MQIEQRFELPVPPAQAWPAFHDIALLVECLPGASLTGPVAGDTVPLRFDVRLGPVAAGFVGEGKVSHDNPALAGRFEGAAADRKTNSRVKGAAAFTLTAQDSGTLVTVLVDYTLSGSLAQFGRAGIVRELASALTAQFAANLEGRLASALPATPSPGAPSSTAPSPATTAAPAMPPAAPVSPAPAQSARNLRSSPAAPVGLGALVLQVMRARWARLTQRLSFRRNR